MDQQPESTVTSQVEDRLELGQVSRYTQTRHSEETPQKLHRRPEGKDADNRDKASIATTLPRTGSGLVSRTQRQLTTVTPVPGDPEPFSGLCRYQAYI